MPGKKAFIVLECELGVYCIHVYCIIHTFFQRDKVSLQVL